MADHYMGVFAENGVTKRFRTSSNWLLLNLPPEIQVSIIAVDQYGFYVAEVHFSQKFTSGIGYKAQDSLVKEGDISSSDNDQDEALETPDQQTYDDALLFLDLDDPYAAPQLKKKAARQLQPYQRSNEVLLVGKLGGGQEKLDSSGGASLYNGASSIGSTTFEFFGMIQNGCALNVRGEVHSFETVETKKTDQDIPQNESFIRSTFDVRFGYEILNKPNLALIPEIGYYYSAVPMLALIDGETGQGSFKGIGLGSLGVGFKIFGSPSKSHRLGGQILFFPVVGRQDFKGYQVDLEYDYFMMDSWFLQAGALRSLNQGEANKTCPVIDGCNESIKSNLTNRQLTIGAGYLW